MVTTLRRLPGRGHALLLRLLRLLLLGRVGLRRKERARRQEEDGGIGLRDAEQGQAGRVGVLHAEARPGKRCGAQRQHG